MSQFLHSAMDSILNLAYPQRCHCCGGQVKEISLGVACGECWAKSRHFDGFKAYCQKCGKPNEGRGTAFVCRDCSSHHYDLARWVATYEHAVKSASLHLKQVPVLCRTFVDRMEPILERSEFTACDLIVPVPLSAQRLADRGFNQAEVIAHAVGKLLNRPIDMGTLVRNKHTPMHRAAMDGKARQQTVENAFGVKRPKLIKGRTILLVDDIYTSGSTASNCAKALKKKGADSVLVFTLARTI